MRDISKVSVFPVLLLLISAAPAAAADDCPALRLLASLNIVPDAAGRPKAQVTIAGQPKYLLIDTGGYRSTLNRATVRELGLRTGSAGIGIIGVTGESSNAFTRAEFGLGAAKIPNYQFFVSPGDDGETSDTEPVGELGPEALKVFDADFDFAGGKLNLIHQNHCEGRVQYWQASAVAIVPFRLDVANHITFPVMIDGKKLNSILDTGASGTTMNLRVAKRLFDVDINTPDVLQVGQLEGERGTAAIYRRRFNTLAIEGITVLNPMITLLPDMVTPLARSLPRAGTMIVEKDADPSLPDLILGMSTLAKLHVYVAYKERKLYVSMPAADTPAPTPGQ